MVVALARESRDLVDLVFLEDFYLTKQFFRRCFKEAKSKKKPLVLLHFAVFPSCQSPEALIQF